MKHLLDTTWLTLLLTLTLSTANAAPLFPIDSEMEKQCIGCHGKNGVSVVATIPHLAGQHKAYLIASLKAYKEGERKHAVMGAITRALSDWQIEELAEYFSKQQCKEVK